MGTWIVFVATLSALMLACGSNGAPVAAAPAPHPPVHGETTASAHPHALRVQPLDQNSEYAIVRGAPTGSTVTLLQNGTPLVSQTVSDQALSFAAVPAAASSPGNLTDAQHLVLQGAFTGAGRSELLAYDGASWWLAVGGGGSLTWTLVQTTSAFGNLNDGQHTWWSGDFEGSGREQVLLYDASDASWRLGAIGGTAQAVAFGSMTWTTITHTSALGWGNLGANPNVYTTIAKLDGTGREELYVFDATTGTQYMGVVDAAGTGMTVGSLGVLDSSSFHDGAHVVWTGRFSGGTDDELLVYSVPDQTWSLGDISVPTSRAQWTRLGAHGVPNLLVSTTQTLEADFTGSGDTELLIFDGASSWTLVRMAAGALSVNEVSDWPCEGCAVYTGSFSGSGATELLAGNRWGRILSPTDPTLQWSDLASGRSPSSTTAFVRVGHYTTTSKSELLEWDPAVTGAGAADWVRFALDPAGPSLDSYVDANTRSLPPFVGDPQRMLFAGSFEGGGVDQLVAYDAVTGSYWLAGFGQAAIALPSLLHPGDAIVAWSGQVASDPVVVANNVSTEHYDSARSGSNRFETTLTAANVLGGASTFSVKGTYDVSQIDAATGVESAHVDAQPLFVHQVPFQPPADAVYVATEADGVYAFPAGASGTPAPIVGRQLVLAGETPLPWADQAVWCQNIYPTVGIAGTPVIDTSTQTLYVVARTRDAAGGHHIRLHALDLVTLQDRPSSPVELATFSTQDSFALLENQRAALLLDHGSVFVTFAGHCDTAPYAGYVFVVDARTLDVSSVVSSVSDPSSTVSGGGIWQGSVGPAAAFAGTDPSRVFMSTGNLVGTNITDPLLGNGVIELSSPYASVGPFWSPANQSTLNAMDWDLASSGIVVLPNQAVLVGGKQGYVYVLDQTTLQCVAPAYRAPSGCATLTTPYPSLDACGFPLFVDASGCPILSSPGKSYPFPGIVGAPAVYTSASESTTLYVKGGATPTVTTGALEPIAYEPATRRLSLGTPAPTVYASSGSVAVSANGASDTGIVWFVNHASGSSLQLVAYDMTDLTRPQSTFAYGPQPTGATARSFAEPMIMDGHVYVGFSGGVSVLGL